MDARIQGIVNGLTFSSFIIKDEGSHQEKVSEETGGRWDSQERGRRVGLEIEISLKEPAPLEDFPAVAAKAGEIVRRARIAAQKGVTSENK